MAMDEALQQQQQQEQAQKRLMLERIKTLPPEEQQAALMQLFQDYEGQEGVLDEQMAQAQALRSQGGPEGVQAGNQYVAAPALSHLARGAERFKGGMDTAKAIQGKRELSDQRTDGQMAVARSQMDQQQQPQQPLDQQQMITQLLRQMQGNQMQSGQL